MTKGPFNNREIATAIWVIIFLSFVLQKSNIRKSVSAVLRAFFRFKILLPVCLMVLYIAAAVVLLAVIDFWKIDFLKDTIVWFFFSAMAMMMRFATSDEAENIFHKIMVDSVKVVIILEFFVNTYTFSLPAELIIVPLLALITMFETVASFDKKYSAVARLSKGIQIIIVLVILAIALSRAIFDLRNLQSLDTVRSITLAPILSLILSPFLYVMVLILKYEIVFLRLDFGIEKDKGLKQYARHQIMIHAGFSLRRLQQLLRNHAVDLMYIQTETDVDHLIQQIENKKG